MQPFLEPCLLGAINYLTTQLKISTPETITPYVEILSSLLEFLAPSQQEDDLFSSMSLEPKTSRVLQILAPSILNTISLLTLDQIAMVKHHFDPIVEILQPYSTFSEINVSRKELFETMRTALASLAQWSMGWGSGFGVPTVDLRYLAAAVRSIGPSVVIRNIVDEMWITEENYGQHASILKTIVMLILKVVVAAMLLTMPFEIGFGRESLANKFLLMVPVEDEPSRITGKSLGPLSNLVRTITNSENIKGENNGEQMIVD